MPKKTDIKKIGNIQKSRKANITQRYSDEAVVKMRQKRLKQWISDSRKVHSDKFDYSRVSEKFNKQKAPDVEIMCNRHKVWFLTSPHYHLRTKSGGCPECKKNEKGKTRIKNGAVKFRDFLGKHRQGNLELVSEYKGIKNNVTVRCSIHQTETTINAGNLLHNKGWGCDECAKEALKSAVQHSPDTAYRLIKNKVPKGIEIVSIYRDEVKGLLLDINCKIHGASTIGIAHAKKSPHFCLDCGKSNMGWVGNILRLAQSKDLSKKAKLALMELEIYGYSTLKVGFTTRKLEERYSHYLKKVFVAYELPALHAAQIEMEIKKAFISEKDERIKKTGMRNGKRWSGDEELYWFRNKDKIIKLIKKRIKELTKKEPDYSELINHLTHLFDEFEPREKDLSNIPTPVYAIDPESRKIIHSFQSVSEAKEKLKLSNISTVINNDLMEEKGRRISGGYYWIKQEDYKPSKIPKRYKKYIYNARKIKCIETNQIFETIAQAEVWAKSLGLGASKIGSAARGDRKTAAGYHWEFVE